MLYRASRMALHLSSLAACALAAAVLATGAPPPKDTDPSVPASNSPDGMWGKNRSEWQVAIYPIFVWAPLFGAHVDVPNTGPVVPGGPTLPGSASGSINGAAAAGFDVLKSGWSAQGDFLWASVSADSSNPKVDIGLSVVYGQLKGGYEFLPHLSLEGGVRRMALHISATVDPYPELSRRPDIWDPLVGLGYRRQLGRKWSFAAHMDGGGFGVGSDVTIGASARADWRFAKHFGATLGGAALHFQVSNTVQNKELKIRQTMYGPLFGFGIYF